jgi:hypothetical protein
MPADPTPMFDDLLQAWCEGRLTDAQRAELEARVVADPAARTAFVNFVHLHASLEHFDRPAALAGLPRVPLMPVAAIEAPAHRAPSLFSLRRPVVRYGIAAALVVALGVAVSVILSVAAQRPADPADSALFFATLVDSADALWDKSDVPTSVGSQLRGGFLRLKSGTAQIEFFSGALVTLTGPAEFGINSEKRAFLKLGRLSAHCPKSAHGFTVAAPGCAVVDMGTAFDMSVDSAGKAAVRVTAGTVELQMNTASEKRGPQRLDAGMAAKVDGAEMTVDSGPNDFPIDVPIANASFEDPVLNEGGWDNRAPGWTDSPADKYQVHRPLSGRFVFYDIPDGHQVLNLSGRGVSQDLGPIVPRAAYTLRFFAGRSMDLPPGEAAAQLLCDGVPFGALESVDTAKLPPGQWKAATLRGVAPGPGRLSIRLKSVGKVGTAIWIDNVSMTVESPQRLAP